MRQSDGSYTHPRTDLLRNEQVCSIVFDNSQVSLRAAQAAGIGISES